MPITLVPESQARPGARFRFAGPNTGPGRSGECDGCPVQKLCFNLQPGHTYQVVALRAARHPCALHDGGRVQAVDVAEAAFASSLESRHLRGTAATWTPIPCSRPDCTNYGLCHPVAAKAGSPHAIEATEGRLECPAGFDLVKVKLRPMGPTA